jgi:hypothetical protein
MARWSSGGPPEGFMSSSGLIPLMRMAWLLPFPKSCAGITSTTAASAIVAKRRILPSFGQSTLTSLIVFVPRPIVTLQKVIAAALQYE